MEVEGFEVVGLVEDVDGVGAGGTDAETTLSLTSNETFLFFLDGSSFVLDGEETFL